MDNVELYYQVARARLDQQWMLNRELGNRVSQVASIAAGFIVISGFVLSVPDTPLETDGVFMAFGGLLVAGCVGAILLGLAALLPQDWRSGPAVEEIAEHIDKGRAVLFKGIANAFKTAVVRNRTLVNRRQWMLAASLVCLAVQCLGFVGVTLNRFAG